MMPPRSFVFLKTDNRGKTKKSDRKLIRSQCMSGRNWRIGRSSGYAAQSDVAGHDSAPEAGREYRPADLYEKLAHLSVPRAPSSDLSVLADNTDVHARLHIVHFLSHAAHIIYPVELCVDFDLGQSNGIRWMFEDSTYLHFILFFSSAVNDAFLRRSFGKTTYYHMGRTINSLSEKVARAELDDSTIAVVSSLVIVTALFTDYKAAKAHVAGLKRIVQLRGGLDAFRHNLSLYIKLARVDFAYALHTGQEPLFDHTNFLSVAQKTSMTSVPHEDDDEVDFDDQDNLSPEDPTVQLRGSLDEFVNDTRVSAVFSDLRHLGYTLNQQRRLQDSDFKVAICSIQYRLLSLENAIDGDVAECLRLAMLVFLTTTFEIPESAGQRYPHLADKFRKSCCAVLRRAPKSQLENEFAVWLLIIGGVSLFGVDEDWLHELWQQLVPASETWCETRSKLKRLLWIDTLHDRLGQQMFDILQGNEIDELTARKAKSSAWWLSGWGICPLEI